MQARLSSKVQTNTTDRVTVSVNKALASLTLAIQTNRLLINEASIGDPSINYTVVYGGPEGSHLQIKNVAAN